MTNIYFKQPVSVINFKNIIYLSFILLSNLGFSQQSNVSSGASVANNVGSVSYSVGQLFYVGNSETTPGMQQTYQLSTSFSERNAEHIVVSIYPNPVSENVTISWNHHVLKTVKAEILNSEGKLFFCKNLTQDKNIDLSNLTGGIFILNIYDNSNKVLKSFKIIKI